MKRILALILKRPVAFVILAAVLFGVSGFFTYQSGKCLHTPFASRGIISLELAWRQERAEQIRSVWTSADCSPLTEKRYAHDTAIALPAQRVIDSAKVNVFYDCFFIPGYVFLFIVLIALRKDVLTGKPLSTVKTLSMAAIVSAAGALDYIENYFLASFLDFQLSSSIAFALPATLKFLLLGIALFHIGWRRLFQFTHFSRGFLNMLWVNRVAVVGLFIVYFALWRSDQGQDLLLNLNSHDIGVASFYVVLTVLATVNWYMPKFLNDATPPTVDTPFRDGTESNVHRILGVMTFIIPACAVLNALVVMRAFPIIQRNLKFFEALPSFLFIVTLAAYIILFEKNMFDKIFGWLTRRFAFGAYVYDSIIVLLLLAIVIFKFLNKKAPQDLIWLSTGLYCLSLAFAMVVSLRRSRNFYTGKLSRIASCKITVPVVLAGSAVSVVFVILNFNPVIVAKWEMSRFVTLPLVFTGVVFYSMFFYGLLIRGKIDKINWAGLVLLIALVMAVVFDNRFHDLHRMPRTKVQPHEKIVPYIKNWVLARETEIRRSDKYPVFIINTYGGGIRAAAWTSLVVGHLDQLTNGQFQRHVIAYSGASGGTVGASVMCAVRKARPGRAFSPEEVVKFYEHDFLTPVLIGMLGRDVFFSTTGWDAIEDRARLQDHTWEEHLKSLTNGYYEHEFGSLWYKDSLCTQRDYDIPLLFSNTYHIENGVKGILAPVGIDRKQFPEAVVIDEKLGAMSIPFSTGAFLSARFPYISPAGKIDSAHHFLDGGLKENSGAETAVELYSLLDSVKYLVPKDPRLDALFDKIEVYFISLNNTGNNDRANMTARNLVEVTAPFTALYNNWVGNTLRADAILKAKYEKNYMQFRPLKDVVVCDRSEMIPVLPLGWQISSCALQRMKESLRHDQNTAETRRILQALNRIR